MSDFTKPRLEMKNVESALLTANQQDVDRQFVNVWQTTTGLTQIYQAWNAPVSDET